MCCDMSIFLFGRKDYERHYCNELNGECSLNGRMITRQEFNEVFASHLSPQRFIYESSVFKILSCPNSSRETRRGTHLGKSCIRIEFIKPLRSLITASVVAAFMLLANYKF